MAREKSFNIAADLLGEIPRERKDMSEEFSSRSGTPDEKKIQQIDINLLVEDEQNDKIYNFHGIEALANSIKKDGVTEPIRAYKMPDSDKYLIQSGHRRRKAALIANLKTVPVIVLEWISDPIERRRKLIEGNLNNREKNAMEIARELDAYASTCEAENEWKKIEHLADVSGRSSASVRRYLSLLTLIPELQEKADNESYSVVALSEAKNMNEEQQKQFNKLIDDYVNQHGEESVRKEILLQFAKQIKNGINSSKCSVPNILSAAKIQKMTKKYSASIAKISELENEELKNAITSIVELRKELDELIKEFS